MDESIRKEVIKAVAENDIGKVEFREPFEETTRKLKRNLIAVSVGALLIAALDLQVSGFLGLAPKGGVALDAAITKGFAGLTVLYFLISFAVSAFVDYSSWRFERERYLVNPYVDLALHIERELKGASRYLAEAEKSLDQIHQEDGSLPRGEDEFLQKRTQYIADGQNSLKTAVSELQGIRVEFEPLLKHWAATVKKTQHLTWRRSIRYLGLWTLDIAVPLVFAVLALYRTQDGLGPALAKLAGASAPPIANAAAWTCLRKGMANCTP